MHLERMGSCVSIAIFIFAFIYLAIGLPECDPDCYKILDENWKSGGQSFIKLAREVDPELDFEEREASNDGRMVVIKIFKNRREYLRELEILPKLDHPNIIKPICRFNNPHYNILFIIFPYYEKGTLLDIPCDTPRDKMIMLGAQIVSAVWYLHELGYTHQDIKPANILLDDSLNAVLIDFAMARRSGIEEHRVGSLHTMAPEVMAVMPREKQPLSPALDWWGVGATLWMANEYLKIPIQPKGGRRTDKTGPYEIGKAKICSQRTIFMWQPRKIPDHFDLDFRLLLNALLKREQYQRAFYGDNREIFEMKYFKNVEWDDNFCPIGLVE